ncbi:MAG: glycosyltransferase family 39 protein, partial [Salibacteraceae bacterium]|nr:glycosyltransferase family 39 protein [Salibacteraceae bacterium]
MIKDRLILLVYSALLFVPFLGAVHLFDWDEINFAESAREMLLTGNWFQVQINFEPFWEKPPLFFWMQVLSMKAFGINEFAARFPNAICGIVTLQVLFSIGLKWQNRTFAWAWTLLYSGSILPFLYFKSGIIDPWFNLFIFLSVYHLFLTLEFPQKGLLKNAAIAGLFSGLAILTKGPVGLLLAILTFFVWLIFNRFKKRFSILSILVFAVTAAAVSSAWFGYEVYKNGPWFLIEFIQYQ